MGKRCFYTLSAIFAGVALIAAEGDAIVIRSATSCFKIPAKQKLNVKTAIARFEAEARRGNVDAKAHLGLFYLRGLGVKKMLPKRGVISKNPPPGEMPWEISVTVTAFIPESVSAKITVPRLLRLKEPSLPETAMPCCFFSTSAAMVGRVRLIFLKR